MTLLSVSKSGLEVGTIIDAVGPPNSSWKQCDGSILLQSDYPKYINNVYELHPQYWGTWEYIDKPTNFSLSGAISKKGSTLVCLPSTGQKVFYSTDDGDTWQESGDVLPSAGNWSVITNNGSIFVALRSGSTAGAYSSDGTSWTGFTMPASKSWNWLQHNGTIFITHGGGSNATLYYSSNGYDWNTGASIGVGVYIYAASKGYDSSGYFLFYGDDFYFYKSNNGSSITKLDNPYYDDISGNLIDYIIRLNDLWWTSNNNSTTNFSVSSDGVSWGKRFRLSDEVYDQYFYIFDTSFYTGEEYIFIDGVGNANYYVSRDGYTFSSRLQHGHQMQLGGGAFVSKSKGIILPCNSEVSSVPVRLLRLKYTSYDYTTHFQLPCLFSNFAGIHKYIKVR